MTPRPWHWGFSLLIFFSFGFSSRFRRLPFLPESPVMISQLPPAFVVFAGIQAGTVEHDLIDLVSADQRNNRHHRDTQRVYCCEAIPQTTRVHLTISTAISEAEGRSRYPLSGSGSYRSALAARSISGLKSLTSGQCDNRALSKNQNKGQVQSGFLVYDSLGTQILLLFGIGFVG